MRPISDLLVPPQRVLRQGISEVNHSTDLIGLTALDCAGLPTEDETKHANYSGFSNAAFSTRTKPFCLASAAIARRRPPLPESCPLRRALWRGPARHRTDARPDRVDLCRHGCVTDLGLAILGAKCRAGAGTGAVAPAPAAPQEQPISNEIRDFPQLD